MKCANCGKPIDPASEEVLCDACIGRQQVIEAIAAEIFFFDWDAESGYAYANASSGTWQEQDYLLKDHYTRKAKAVLALTYPSGQPMIAVLSKDQRLPEHPPLAQEAIERYGKTAATCRIAGYEQAKIDMADWRRILPDGGK